MNLEYKMVNRDLCNTKVMYIRAWGMTIPLDEAEFIQVNPNNGELVQRMSMKNVINLLVRHNIKDEVEESEWV